MLGVGNLLLNFLYILISLLVFFSQGWYKSKNRHWIIGILAGLGIIFCMSFPFTAFPGYFFDLRIIPVLIAVLYGNKRAALVVVVVLVGYRYILGGDGFYATVFSYIPIILFGLIALKWVRILKMSLTTFGTLLALTTVLLIVGTLYVSVPNIILNNFVFFFQYIIVVVLCMWVSLFLADALRENIRMREEMQRREKMQVVSELAATIAHEIRNPITVTKGFLQLLQPRMNDSLTRSYADLALDEIERADSILSDYLLYANPDTLKIEKLDVKEHLLDMCKQIEPHVQSEGHQLHVEAEDSLFIQADANYFHRAVTNILQNSLDALHQKGEISVRAYARDSDIFLEIKDNGCGMNEEQIKRLGEPFYSTKAKGTGLGLMVTYKFISMLNGRVDVESKEGEGTTFTIAIPKAS